MRAGESPPVTLALPPQMLWDTLDSEATITTIETPFDDFHIKFAKSNHQLQAANLLVEKMYLSRGYSIEHVLNNVHHGKTLVVETDGEVIGTMAICMDGKLGLPADENYRDKLDELRRRGRKLCEPSRLAIRRTLPHRVFAALIHTSYLYSHKIHDCTDYIIEVNPRHAAFYKKILGFEELGGLRTCKRVNAPALLLSLECVYIEEHLKKTHEQ
jgi:hypothetical protein